MVLTLYKEDFFDSAHSLCDYEGKCSELHGHTWKLSVWVRGEESELQPNGILWDFSNIKKITAKLDHKNLNEVLDVNPTAENLSLYIYRELKRDYSKLQFKVRVYENSLTRIAYCETGDFNDV